MSNEIHHRDTEGTEAEIELEDSSLEPLYPCQAITDRIIRAAIEVHRCLGPGLLESAYESCLADELTRNKVRFVRQVALPVHFKGRDLDCGYRLGLLVEDQVVVELKCVEKLASIHNAQLLTYLRLSQKKVGLLINFNVELLKDGLVRRVL